MKLIRNLFKPIGRLMSNDLHGIKTVTTLYVGGTSLLILVIGLTVAAFVGTKYFKRVIILNMKSYVYSIKSDFVNYVEIEKAQGAKICSGINFHTTSKEDIRKYSVKFLGRNKGFLEAIITDSKNNVLTYVTLNGVSPGPTFEPTINKYNISEVEYVNGAPTVVIKYAISSNLTAYLRLDLTRPYSMFLQTPKTGVGDIFLLSHRGDAISPLKSADKINEKDKDIISYNALSRPGKPDVVNQAIKGLGDASLMGYSNYHDERSVAIWTGLDQLSAYIVYEMEYFEAFSKPYFLVAIIISFGIIVFGLLLVLILFLSKKISRPIIKMSDSIYKLSEGDYSAEPPMNASYYEVDRLWRAFSRLKQDLNELAENTHKISKGELEEVIEGRGPLIDSFREMQMSLIDRDLKIRKNQRELKKVNEELDSFVYVASHDLKEPLRGIQAFSQFLLKEYRDKIDKKGQGFIDRITKNVKRMDSLITDLLNLSRVERIRNPFEDTNMNNLVKNILNRFEFSISEKKIKIDFNEDLPVCYCDRVKMTEVFANLISNAIKYGPKDNPEVKIGFNSSYDPPYFYVEDNGEGIEDKYHQKIFEMFQRLERKTEGTGAGLYIVKKIIELHSGVIWVESTVGSGTSFKFCIPNNLKDQKEDSVANELEDKLLNSSMNKGGNSE